MLAENVLRKHVAIIHAYSIMSSLQRKIFNILLYQATAKQNNLLQEETIAVECVMSLSELIKAVNFNSNNTQYVKVAVDGLASLKIEWNLLKDKLPSNISFLNLRVLHGSPTFFQDGTFNFSFHKLMIDLARIPDIYGTIDIDLQTEFESKYGHSLYENSTRFVNMQKGKIIGLDTFRKLLGVSEGKYHSMRELTRNVIKPAVEEVNDRADFVVDLQSIKAGRKVTGFELIVNSKNKKLFNKENDNNEKSQIILDEITKAFGKMADSVLKNILKNYSYEYIFEKISYTKQHAKKESFGLYPIPYFISALKNDYKNKEQILEENKKQSSKNEKLQKWQEKLDSLQYSLASWKRNLQVANNNGNEPLIEKINTIIMQYEKSLEQLLSEKLEIKSTGEDG